VRLFTEHTPGVDTVITGVRPLASEAAFNVMVWVPEPSNAKSVGWPNEITCGSLTRWVTETEVALEYRSSAAIVAVTTQLPAAIAVKTPDEIEQITPRPTLTVKVTDPDPSGPVVPRLSGAPPTSRVVEFGVSEIDCVAGFTVIERWTVFAAE
jgi:hypothetical protein